MYYLECVAAHEMHGPFYSVLAAHKYAADRQLCAYRVHQDVDVTKLHQPASFRLVPEEERSCGMF